MHDDSTLRELIIAGYKNIEVKLIELEFLYIPDLAIKEAHKLRAEIVLKDGARILLELFKAGACILLCRQLRRKMRSFRHHF